MKRVRDRDEADEAEEAEAEEERLPAPHVYVRDETLLRELIDRIIVDNLAAPDADRMLASMTRRDPVLDDRLWLAMCERDYRSPTTGKRYSLFEQFYLMSLHWEHYHRVAGYGGDATAEAVPPLPDDYWRLVYLHCNVAMRLTLQLMKYPKRSFNPLAVDRLLEVLEPWSRLTLTLTLQRVRDEVEEPRTGMNIWSTYCPYAETNAYAQPRGKRPELEDGDKWRRLQFRCPRQVTETLGLGKQDFRLHGLSRTELIADTDLVARDLIVASPRLRALLEEAEANHLNVPSAVRFSSAVVGRWLSLVGAIGFSPHPLPYIDPWHLDVHQGTPLASITVDDMQRAIDCLVEVQLDMFAQGLEYLDELSRRRPPLLLAVTLDRVEAQLCPPGDARLEPLVHGLRAAVSSLGSDGKGGKHVVGRPATYVNGAFMGCGISNGAYVFRSGSTAQDAPDLVTIPLGFDLQRIDLDGLVRLRRIDQAEQGFDWSRRTRSTLLNLGARQGSVEGMYEAFQEAIRWIDMLRPYDFDWHDLTDAPLFPLFGYDHVTAYLQAIAALPRGPYPLVGKTAVDTLYMAPNGATGLDRVLSWARHLRRNVRLVSRTFSGDQNKHKRVYFKGATAVDMLL